MSATTADIAHLVVSADWDGDALERGMERAGIKYDQLASRMRDGSGRFVAFGDANKRAGAAVEQHNTALVQLTSKLQDAGQAIQQVGQTLTVGLTLPLLVAAGAIIKIGSSTETAINRIQGVTRVGAAEMDKVRAKARELGKDLTLPNTSARDAADAMLELAKGGLTLEQSMDAARGTIQLAKAAMLGEKEAATITADALNTFGLAGDQAGRVADLLAGAASNSSGEVTHMAAALAQVGAVARGANVSIEDTMTLVSLLAKNGVKGSDAGTSLKTFLSALQTPVSKESAGYIKALIDSAYEGGKLKPVTQLIGEFQKSLGGLDEQARNNALREIFGQDAIRAARIIFGEGVEGFNKMSAGVTRSGQAAEQAAAATKGLAGAWGGLLSVVETVAFDIFEDIKAPLTSFVQTVTEAVSYAGELWNSLGSGGKAVVGVLAAVAAAAGPVLTVIGMVAAALVSLGGSVAGIASAVTAAGGLAAVGAILAPIAVVALKVAAVVTAVVAVVVGASAAIAYAWATNFGGVRDFTLAAFNAIKAHVTQALAIISEAWARIFPTIQSITEKVLSAVSFMWKEVGVKIGAAVLAAWNVVSPLMLSVGRIVLETVNLVLKIIDGDWKRAWESFARLAVEGVYEFAKALDKLKVFAIAAVIAAIDGIMGLAERFKSAAAQLALRFIFGFNDMVERGKAAITVAITNALIDAAAGVRPEAIAAGVAARFIASLHAAISSGAAEQKAFTTQSNDGEFVGPGEVGRNIGQSAPAAPKAPASFKLPGGGGKGGGGGGGESPAMKRARAELDAIKIVEEAFQRATERRGRDEQFQFDNSLKAIESYTLARKGLAKEQRDSELKVAEAELKVAQQTKGSAAERKNAVAAAQQAITDIHTKYEQAVTDIDREQWKHRLEADKAGWAGRTALLEEEAAGWAAVYARMAEQGTMAFRAAGDITASHQEELLLREQKRIQNELGKVDSGSQEGKDLKAELDVIAEKIRNFREQVAREAEDNDLRDRERGVARVGAVRSVMDSIVDIQFQGEAARLSVLEAAGVGEEVIWKRRLDLDLRMEEVRRARRVADLRRQAEHIAATEKNEAHRAEMITAVNQLIEAEERESAARRDDIQEGFYTKQREKLERAADRIMDTFRRARDRFKDEGWKGFFKGIGESFLELLEKMADDLLKSRLMELLRNWKGVPAAPTGGASAPGAGGGGNFLTDFFRGVFNFGGGSGDANAVSEAGEAATGAIKDGWEKSKGAIEQTGDKQAKSLTAVGQSIVSTLAQMISVMAAGAGRGSFWKGLLFAAASGAISGAMGALFKPGGGGGGALSDGQADVSNIGGGLTTAATGGLLKGPGSGTSDSILGVDPRTNAATAWVSNGEYVVKASSVARLGKGALDYINEYGRLPELSIGGMLRKAFAAAKESSMRRAFNAANPRGLRRDLGGGAFEFRPPYALAGGGFVGSSWMPEVVQQHAPLVGDGGGAAGGTQNVFHVSLTQMIHTPDAPSFHRSARQTSRRAMNALQSEATARTAG